LLAIHGSGGGYDQGIRVIAMSRFGYLRTPMHTDASAAAQADAHCVPARCRRHSPGRRHGRLGRCAFSAADGSSGMRRQPPLRR